MTGKLSFDVAVVGGGIVGLATARALMQKAGLSLVLLEAEKQLAAHQTGNNSGVIHSGLYYKPGSLKAHNCVEGRKALIRFCEESGIPYESCGKVVVATDASQIPALDLLEERGRANGLVGLQRLGPEGLHEYEPHVRGCDGLLVPETGIVDYVKVAKAFAEAITERGGEVLRGTRVLRVKRGSQGLVLETTAEPVRCRYLINCGGLYSDRIARLCGLEPALQIIPFRGEYYKLRPESHHLVKNLIYPVPDPKFPFLGVHFTRMIRGGVEAGPNAVLAFKREGYSRWSFSPRDTLQYACYPGFWRMASKYWRTGLAETFRSFSKSAFVRSLQFLIPEVRREDLQPGGAGVRAQALEPSGKLVDDFRIEEDRHMIHVLNAPSPAATASISIGRTIADRAARSFDLGLED